MDERIQPEKCVTDAAMLQDLGTIRLTPALLDSGVNLITTPNVVAKLDQSCRLEVQEFCSAGKIAIEGATVADMNELINEVGPVKGMTGSDRLLCRIAKRMKALILTGCGYLSREAEQRGIRTRSLIWVLERLVTTRVLKPVVAARKLEELQQRSPWMSKSVTQKQIERWKTMVEPTLLATVG